MTRQIEFTLEAMPRGCHLITANIMRQLPQLPQEGILHLFVKHTSCALAINENADSDVRQDLETIFNHLVPENAPYYLHTFEGEDDMPAHAKTVIVGNAITIPITQGHLNLGIWQGIYLCEFRNYGGKRRIVATILA